MTNDEFGDWMRLRSQQTGKPYRKADAARDLGVHQATIDRALAKPGHKWPKHYALACAAIAAGLAPIGEYPNPA